MGSSDHQTDVTSARHETLARHDRRILFKMAIRTPGLRNPCCNQFRVGAFDCLGLSLYGSRTLDHSGKRYLPSIVIVGLAPGIRPNAVHIAFQMTRRRHVPALREKLSRRDMGRALLADLCSASTYDRKNRHTIFSKLNRRSGRSYSRPANLASEFEKDRASIFRGHVPFPLPIAIKNPKVQRSPILPRDTS